MPFRSRFLCWWTWHNRTGRLLDAIQASPRWDFRPVWLPRLESNQLMLAYQASASPVGLTAVDGGSGVDEHAHLS